MRCKNVLLSAAMLLVLAIQASAQVSTGTPFMASMAGGPDAINLGNLNINWTFPLINKPGRGMPFVLAPSLDSSIWSPVTSGSTTSWQPNGGWGWSGLPSGYNGYVTYTTPAPLGPFPCGQPVNGNSYYYEFFQQWFTNFIYVDAHGTSHPFSMGTNPYYQYVGSNGCQNGTQSGPGPAQSGTATDGSAYSIVATPSSQYGASSALSDGKGKGISLLSSSNTQEDVDGNLIQCTASSCTDTLNTTVMTVSGSSSNPPIIVNTPGPSGTVQYKINYSQHSVRTHFNCPNINEYGPTSVWLVDSIVLPDQREYVITYEPTPGYSNVVTGRIAAITLPSDPAAPTFQYTYSGGGTGVNGIQCSDGSAPTLSRQTPDGTWTYTRTTSAPQTITRVSAPAVSGVVDETQIQFLPSSGSSPKNYYEIGRRVYSGLVGTGTPLETVLTCYASATTGCRTQYSAPYSDASGQQSSIQSTSAKVVTIQSPSDAGVSSGFIDTYDFNGNLNSHEVHDYGALGTGTFATSPTFIHQSIYYMTYSGYDSSTGVHINGINQLQQDYVAYVSGGQYVPVSFLQNYFDETQPIASGAPARSNGLCSSGCSPGHITSTYQWISGGNPILGGPFNNDIKSDKYLKSTATYYDTGVVSVATDPKGTQTTYTFGTGSCGYAFPTKVSTQTGGSVVTHLDSPSTWNCSGGVMASSTDVNGNLTTYTFGANGYPYWSATSSTNQATGQVISFSYPTSSSNSSSTTMSFNGGASVSASTAYYDALGRPILQQTQETPTPGTYDSVAIAYDARGRKLSQTVPYAASADTYTPVPSTAGTTITYDGLDRLHKVTDGGGGWVQYDPLYNDVKVTTGPAATLPATENMKVRNLEYNGAGWLISVCEVVSSTLPAGGSCAQTTSNTGYLTKYTYDAAGRLITVNQNSQAGSSGMQTRTITYDGLGRTTLEYIPEWSAGTGSSGHATYTYDSIPSGTCSGSSAGDLIKKVDAAGNVTCYTYDAQHRVLTAKVASGTATDESHYVYDAATYGSTAMQNAQGALAEAYTCSGSTCAAPPYKTDEFFSVSPVTTGPNAGGALLQTWQSTPNSGSYFLTQEGLYPNGTPASITASLNGSSIGIPNVSYGLDGEGRPYSAAAGAASVTATTYNSASQPTAVTFANPGTGAGYDGDSYGYDPSTGRITSLTYHVIPIPTAPQITATTSLTWNANGSLQQMQYSQSNDSTKNQTCKYSADDIGRISKADCGSSTWVQTFAYDPFGNIKKTGNPGTSYSANYSTATNQVSSGITPSPAYDGNGNQLNSTQATLTWNALSQPVSVNGTTATYDALGRMVETVTGSSVEQFVFLSTGEQLAVYSGSLVKGTIHLPGGADAVYNASGLAFTRHKDWLGSSRITTTWTDLIPQGWQHALSGTEAYAPFGEVESNYESGTTDRNFTGQDQNVVSGSGATGVYDFLLRKYDPSAGRWLSPDPAAWGATGLELPQSFDRYSYALNNPLTLADPDGLCPTHVTWTTTWDGVSVTSQWDDGKPCFYAPSTGISGGSGPPGSPFGGIGSGPGYSGGGSGGGDLNPDCKSALKRADRSAGGVARADAAWPVLQLASITHGIPTSLLAAVGVEETDFKNRQEVLKGGAPGPGMGYFQLTNQQGVSRAQAFDLFFSANYAANMLSSNMSALSNSFSFTPGQLLQATAASYNFGTGNIHGNPNKIDVGTANGHYGSDVSGITGCFSPPGGAPPSFPFP